MIFLSVYFAISGKEITVEYFLNFNKNIAYPTSLTTNNTITTKNQTIDDKCKIS